MEASLSFPIYRAALSGLLAMLVTVGIARFGYSPLVPALVAAHWYSAAAAFWLGAINLLGYFFGAAFMRVWRGPLAAKPLVLWLMGLTALALLCSAFRLGPGWAGLAWFGFWRLLSGVTGGIAMVLMAAAVVGRAPPAARGKVGGITFAGMGTGITLSSLLLPVLLRHGLVFTWVALALLAAAATLIVAWAMPAARIPAPPRAIVSGQVSRPVRLLVAAYALSALGFVPHMLFWASFVAIGLHRGVAAGSDVSAWLGIAAAIGPVLLGRLADRIGFLPSIVAGYVVMALAVALPLVNDAPLALDLSAIGVGAIALGSVMLVAGAIAHLVPPARLAADWGFATMTYAVMQALTAAGFSALFHLTDSFLLLFGIGVAALSGSVLLVIAARRAHASSERNAG